MDMKPLTADELDVLDSVQNTAQLVLIGAIHLPKRPWYSRAWRWFTSLFVWLALRYGPREFAYWYFRRMLRRAL